MPIRHLFILVVALLSAEAAAESAQIKIKVALYGDSLSAGYGVKPDEALYSVLDKKLKAYRQDVEVINVSVSGDTTVSGKGRVANVISLKPNLVILALGANDMLRNVNPDETHQNLKQIITELQKNGIQVMLAGMRAHPTHPPAFASKFNAVYPKLASEMGITLMPFLLEGVAGKQEMNLGDMAHPNPQGISLMADKLLPHVYSELKKLK